MSQKRTGAQSALDPIFEKERLRELHSLGILDTAAEERFDRYTELVADIFDVPIALISLVDADRQWFKSAYGLDITETLREIAFCSETIRCPELLIIPDAALDPRFADNPLVTGEPFIRFYAGAQIHGPKGKPLGSLCLIDRRPRHLSAADQRQLRKFAALVEQEIQHRYRLLSVREETQAAANQVIKRLQDSERRLQIVLEAAHMAVWEWDIGSDRLVWTKQLQTLLEPTIQKESSSQAYFARVHAEDREAARQQLAAALDSLQEFRLEHRILMENGEVRWVQVDGRVERDSKGIPRRTLGAIQDITGRKAAEIELRDSREKYQALAEVAPVGIYETDPQGLCTYMSEFWQRITGRSPNEALGHGWIDSIHPDDRVEVESQWLAACAQGVLFKAEYRLTHTDGTLLWVLDRAVARKGGNDGEVISYVGTVTDIHARKLAEQKLKHQHLKLAEAALALKKEKEFSEALVSSIPNIFYVFDLNGHFIRWNRAFEAITEFSGEDMKTAHPLDFFRPEDQPLIAERIQEAIDNGQSTTETGLRSKGGSVRPYLFTAARISIGGETYLAGVGIDITERLKTEQDLRLRHRAIEASPSGIAVISLRQGYGVIEDINPAFEKLTGYAKAEIMGQPCDSLFLGTSEPESFQSVCQGGRARDEIHQVVQIMRKDRSAFWSDFRAAPVSNEEGEATHLVVILTDITETKQYEAELEYRANYDELTGLANRNLLVDRLRQELLRAQRNRQELGIVFIDLDNFKFINDTLGHAIGDKVLKEAAARLQSCIRHHDTVARMGGDEFIILLTEVVDEERIAWLMQRILDAISSPILIDGNEVLFTCSLGISLYPRDGQDVYTLLKHADTAMYQAKDSGRNNFWFFTPEMNRRLRERVQLEQSLRKALEKEQLSIHYQPQFDLLTGDMVGAEALLRWEHPQLGEVTPSRFIPLAEETGLIIPISEWVLECAAGHNRRWQQQGYRCISVAVNLSSRHFRDKDLVKTIEAVLHKTGLAPCYLKCEITESHMMKDPDTAIRTLLHLKDLGIGLSIDDFGTGYSSMSYLKQFPIDQLKIDRSFIKDVHRDADDAAISRAVISLGHSLSLRVIAEGVELAEQSEFLADNGCDEVQGYYFSKPLPVTKFEESLRAACL